MSFLPPVQSARKWVATLQEDLISNGTSMIHAMQTSVGGAQNMLSMMENPAWSIIEYDPQGYRCIVLCV